MQVLRVKVSMSDMLDLDDQPKIIKEGSPQVLTCGDPSHRRDDRIRTCDPLTPRVIHTIR